MAVADRRAACLHGEPLAEQQGEQRVDSSPNVATAQRTATSTPEV